MNEIPPSKNNGQKAWIALRFLLFGFVGFWIMLYSMLAFAMRIFDLDHESISPFFSLPLALVGAIMMLYGVGEWGRWAYLWVFLSVPVSLCLVLLIPGGGNDKGLPGIVAALAAFVTYAGVQGYYARRED